MGFSAAGKPALRKPIKHEGTNKVIEANFDGLVGPTHNYGGLSYGNRASLSFKNDFSSPKQAALQGLFKAKALHDAGVVQGVIPPQMRPNFNALRNLGIEGNDLEVAEYAYKLDPTLLSICSSSSCMWTANAATVAPSCDTADRKVHFIPANLLAKPHRAMESPYTQRALEGIFKNKDFFSVHPALNLGDAFSDEGAANHTRLENAKTKEGLHLFVYGRKALDPTAIKPVLFPARQTMEASHAVARVNSIRPELCYFVQQNPDVIDEGVFHNDVISVGHKNVFLYHEKSFLDTDRVIDEIDQRLDHTLIGIKVTSKEVSVEQAVQTYLFNSQIISLSDREMALVAPQHCKEEPSVKAFIDKMLKSPDNPINKVFYFDLLQSMKNGGGPACLRLRVQLTKEELLNVNKECLLTDQKYNQLVQWVEKNYRDTLTTKDLFDPQFIGEVKRALEDLTVILKLPGIYNF